MVEQLICNQQVAGSSPIASSSCKLNGVVCLLEGFPSGQREQTVNLSATDFEGSNPSPSTTKQPSIEHGSQKNRIRGSSSVGRAPAFQAGRRGFESRLPLQLSCRGFETRYGPTLTPT